MSRCCDLMLNAASKQMHLGRPSSELGFVKPEGLLLIGRTWSLGNTIWSYMVYMVGHMRVSVTRSNDTCNVSKQPHFSPTTNLIYAYLNEK